MVNEAELRVISHVRKNARKSVSGIAADSGMSASYVLSKLKKLEKSTVKKYTSLVDFKMLGYNVLINFAIKAEDKDKEALLSYLLNHPSINSVSIAAKDYDFYVEAVFKDIKGHYDFTESLSDFALKKIDEHYIIEELKKEEFLSMPLLESVIVYPKHMDSE